MLPTNHTVLFLCIIYTFIIYFEMRSHSVPLHGLEYTVQTRWPSNLQLFSCSCFLEWRDPIHITFSLLVLDSHSCPFPIEFAVQSFPWSCLLMFCDQPHWLTFALGSCQDCVYPWEFGTVFQVWIILPSDFCTDPLSLSFQHKCSLLRGTVENQVIVCGLTHLNLWHSIDDCFWIVCSVFFCIYICVYCIYMCVYVGVHVFICMSVYMNVCIYAGVCAYMCIYMYVHVCV